MNGRYFFLPESTHGKAKISKSFALVLVYDLLCSKQGIAAASGPIKDAILRHKTRLKADYVRAQLSRKVKAEGTVNEVPADRRDVHAPMGESEHS